MGSTFSRSSSFVKDSSKRGVRILLVTKDITKPIEDNVINAGYDYIAIYSDGSNGTIFKTPSGSMAISDEIYWNIGGLRKFTNNKYDEEYCFNYDKKRL